MTLQEKFDELWRLALMDQPSSPRSDEARRKCFGLWLSGVAEVCNMIMECDSAEEFAICMDSIRDEVNRLRDGLNLLDIGRN